VDQISGENEPTPGFRDAPYNTDLATSDPYLDDEALEAMIEKRVNERLEEILKQKQEADFNYEKKSPKQSKDLEENETFTSLQVEKEAKDALDKIATR